MSDFDSLLKRLKKSGKKITKVRMQIISIIYASKSPITVPKIIFELSEIGAIPNKTTVYREIAFLLENKLITEVILTPHIIHYESAMLPHHHHLVCEKCGNVNEVMCTELGIPLKKLKKRVRASGFKISEHNLEFRGLCSNCQ